MTKHPKTETESQRLARDYKLRQDALRTGCGRCHTFVEPDKRINDTMQGRLLCPRCASAVIASLWSQVQDQSQRIRNIHSALFEIDMRVRKTMDQ